MATKPQECASINEIRIEIDRIDKQIIDLIGERLLYVREIVNYKSTAEEVQAKTRYDEVLAIRKKWAEDKELDPVVIEQIYKTLIASFIEEQMKLLKKKTAL